jgi:parvulin-like peptidyl-prolyl isomerase
LRILAIIGAVLLGALLIFVGAFGARWFMLPENGGGTPAVEPVASNAAGGADSVPTTLDLESIRELLAVIDANRRRQILDSRETFEQFVRQETVNQSVLTAAYANGANENEAIGVLMERAARRILAEAYLNQVVRLNLDPGFPSDEQVREAYENNQDAFRVPERMHLWQIFIPLENGASDDDIKAAWKLADRIAADLRAGKADFAAMAKEHSGHEASRVNDGYMGLIKVAELLPAVAEAAQKLEVNGISPPIATETGLHILRKGATVASELVDFDSVRGTIRERLQREAAQKVRQAAVQKISEEFPVSAPESDLESWRGSLLEEVAAPVVPAAAAADS